MKDNRPRRRKHSRCPECGEMTVMPITYGLPDEQDLEAEQRGEILLGGCILFDGQAKHACTSCDWSDQIEIDRDAEQ